MLYDECFPHLPTYKKKKKKKLYKQPWITDGLLTSIQKRHKLYKRYLKNPSTGNKKRHTIYKNKLTLLLRNAKQKYYYNLFQKHKSDLKKTWSQINDILGKKNYSSMPNIMFHENNKYDSRQGIVNSFNTFFSNVGKTISKNIPDVKASFTDYLTEENNSSLFLNPTSVFEIIEFSKTLKPFKASGPDDISPRVVRECIHFIAEPLCDIYNKSISTGIVPDKLKLAKIIPLYKKNDKNKVQNYRPVALLPIFAKLLEKILHQRIYTFFDKNKLLIDEQFGFRKNYSTSSGVLHLTEYISKQIDGGNFCVGVFMDLSKAFDTIDHRILLRKLYYYGIRGIALDLFENYLSNRKQYVVVDGVSSNYETVNCGVPQGSVLGPLLFLIYVNDIKQASNIFKFSLFADDTSTVASHSNPSTLIKIVNQELVKLNNWFLCNRLHVNYDKTNYMIFRSRNRRVPNNLLPVSIGENVIQRKDSLQFLGVIIDEHLSWKNHITHISAKLSRSIGILSRLKYILPFNVLKMLYNSIIVPHLNYCNVIWGHTFKSYLEKLYLLQKRAIRIITKSDYRLPAGPLFVKLGVLPVYELIKFHTLLFMFKLQNENFPSIPSIKFILNSDIHSYSTRQRNNLRLPRNRTTRACNSFYRVGIKEWNSLNIQIKDSSTVSRFKLLLKRSLVDNIKERCSKGNI